MNGYDQGMVGSIGEGESGTITVMLNGRAPSPEGLMVNYTVQSGPSDTIATPGEDYIPLPGSVLIPAGQSRADIPVISIDDQVVEFREDVPVTLAPGSFYEIGQPSNGGILIEDDDKLIASIAATDPDAAEAGADPGTFTITLDRAVPEHLGAVTISYTVNGTATPDADYTALSGNVSIAANHSSATITVMPLDDSNLDPAETVIVTLQEDNNQPSYTVGSPNNATVIIADNEPPLPVAMVTATDPNAAEAGADPGAFTVTLDRVAPAGGVTINYTVNGTATPGADYTTLSGSVTIAANQSSATIPVIPQPDSLAESPETVVLTLAPGTGYQVGSPNSATVTITDTPLPAAMVTATDPNAAETGPDTGTFTVTLSQPAPSGGVTVNYTVSGAATSGADYTALSGSVTIAANQPSATIPVTPQPDSLAESPETVVVTLSAGSGYSVGSPSSATVIIADTPLPVATVTATDPNAAETGPDTGTFTITLSQPAPSGGVTVNYTVSGAATSGADYTALSGSVTIAANQPSATIPVTPQPDSLAESPETVVVTLSSGSGYIVGTPNSATVTITDTPLPVATVTATDPNAAEAGADPGAFTVTLDRVAPAGGVTINYTVNGTATPGADYTTLSGSVTIAANQSSATIPVIPQPDSLVESPETVVLTLAPGTGYQVGSPNSATVTITDIPPPVATVTATDPTAAEVGPDPGTFTVTLNRAAPAGGVTVNYSVGGSATPGSDYTALSGNVLINADQTSATITVMPLDDSNFDPAETVIVTLQSGSGYAVGSPDNATVTIADNDPPLPIIPIATVTATDPNAAEAGPDTGTFTVTLDQPAPNGGVTVSYSVGGNTTPGLDYTTVSGNVLIATGQTSATITVRPLDDLDVDPAETVIVTLTPGTSYQVGSPNSATVTIADNDSPRPITPTVTVTATDPEAAEIGPDTGTFTVTLDRPAPPEGVTISYSVGDSATPGTDYTALSGSVPIASGQTSATITVTPLDDPGLEPSETVVVTLQSGIGYQVGSPSSATVTIADNDQLLPPGLEIRIEDGNNQSGTPGTPLQPFVVSVTAAGQPQPGVTVSWEVMPTDAGTLQAGSTATDASGRASNTLTVLQTQVISVTARVQGVGSVTFMVNGLALSGMTQNQQEVGRALNAACPAVQQNGGGPSGQTGLQTTCNQLAAIRATGNNQAVAAALQQLAPEEVAAQGVAAMEVSTAQFTNIFTRLAELRGGGVGLVSLKSLRLDYAGLSLSGAVFNGLLAAGRGGGASSDQESAFGGRFGTFISGRISFGNQNSTDNAPGFDFDTYGITVGADYRFTDKLVLGIAAGYAFSDADFDEDAGGLDLHGYSVSLYGTYYLDKIFIEGIATVGWNSYDTRRRIVFGTVDETAKGDTDDIEYSFSLGAGYDFTRGGFTFGPRARVSYTRAEIDGYEERDAGGNELAIDEQTVKSLTTAFGIQATYAISTRFGVISPQLLIEWEHEFEDDNRSIEYRFLNDPTNTQAKAFTDSPDRDRFNVGIGVSAILQGGKSAFIYYETTVGEEDRTEHNISAGLRIEF